MPYPASVIRHSIFAQSFSIVRTCLLISLGAVLVVRPQLASAQAAELPQAERVTVSGEPVPSPTPYDDRKAKRDHIMSEVSGTEITVTKKATVIKLDKQPPIENNNLQEEFIKAPGLLVTEQHTPGQFNFSYRGLGNPQESEFVLVLRDGVPLSTDWIGFPTLYYLPLPQSISEIDFIRGGNSLIYGPEPAPAINFVTRHPDPGTPWTATTENIGGAYGFYSTYDSVQEASGPVETRVASGYAHSEGQRDNSAYDLWQFDGYFGYRPDENQLLALDFYASRFDGGDPGRLPSVALFNQNQNQTLTPYNEDWVDRYTAVLRYEWHISDDWFMQAKLYYTHEELDSRAAANLGGNVVTGPNPSSTTFGYEEFNNGGADLRFRHDWGEGTMFKGSTLTFGGQVYHGDAPFDRYTLNAADFGPNYLYAPRGSTASITPLEQSRTADYQSIFIEDLFRLGKFHVVGSFRLDHETVEVDSTYAPWLPNPTLTPPTTATTGPASISADHWVPLWGFGMGNDFGNNNETYFSASSGWRPTRFFDIAGTSRTIPTGVNPPDPFHSLDFELGVHGTPFKGFWYDVGGFWMVLDNRTEQLNEDANGNPSNTDFIIQNTGTTRNRGFEGELYYDFLAQFQHPPEPLPTEDSKDKNVADSKNTHVPGVSLADYHPYKLMVFSNVQYLDAVYTDSGIPLGTFTTQTFVGKAPAFAPSLIVKGGITFQRDHYFDLTFTAVHVSSQYWQDSDLPSVTTGTNPLAPPPADVLIPAKIPPYTVFDLAGSINITRNIKLIGGISNLADKKYYDRIFSNGIEPAMRRSGWGGISITF